jgi:hypothetical protein
MRLGRLIADTRPLSRYLIGQTTAQSLSRNPLGFCSILFKPERVDVASSRARRQRGVTGQIRQMSERADAGRLVAPASMQRDFRS